MEKLLVNDLKWLCTLLIVSETWMRFKDEENLLVPLITVFLKHLFTLLLTYNPEEKLLVIYMCIYACVYIFSLGILPFFFLHMKFCPSYAMHPSVNALCINFFEWLLASLPAPNLFISVEQLPYDCIIKSISISHELNHYNLLSIRPNMVIGIGTSCPCIVLIIEYNTNYKCISLFQIHSKFHNL